MEKKAIGKYFNVGITLFLMGIIFIAYVYEDYFFSDFTPLIMPIAKILLIFLFLTLLFWLILTDYSCHTLINLLDKLPVSLKDWLNNNPVYFILLLSGLFGFCMSLKISPYQPYVESGQVIAGIVNYPIDNPFYYYHHKLITLIKELAALFLYLGIPEKITGTILMAMVVTIGFQGISLAIFAISKQKLISVLSPFVLLYFFLDMRSYYIRINYAILFFDAYSGLSLSYTMLTLSLIALKKYKSGALLLGLSLAIHPTMGAWISFIGGLTLLWWYFSAKLVIKPYLKFYIIGFLLSSVYLFYHFYTTYAIKLPYASPEVIEQFFLATLEWSNHHRKFPLGDFITERGFILLIISFIIHIKWLKSYTHYFSPTALFFIHFSLISIPINFILIVLTNFIPEYIPAIIVKLMPGRFINISNLLFIFLLFIFIIKYFQNYNLKSGWHKSILLFGYRLMFAFVLLAFMMGLKDYFHLKGRIESLFKNEAPWTTAISDDPGMILLWVGDDRLQHHIAIKTRRPVLLDDTALTCIPYLPETGPQYQKILEEVYGIDLFSIAQGCRLTDCCLKNAQKRNKSLWESRDFHDWQKIRLQFDVRHIVIPADIKLKLQLPLKVKNDSLWIYYIPKQL